MDPVKIAFLHQTSTMGGVEFSTLYLSQQLDPKRFHPLVICPQDGELPARCRVSGVDVVVDPWPRFFNTGLVVHGHTMANPFALFANGVMISLSAKRLAKQLLSLEVKLVCTKGMFAHFYGGLAGRLCKLPVVWHLQDMMHPRRALGLYPALLSLGGWFLADQVIVDAAAISGQLWPMVRRSRGVTVIYNGVDTAELHPELDGRPLRQEFGLGPTDLVVGTVARLTPWKGQAVMVRAAALLAERFPACRFLVIGAPVFDTDRYERALRRLVEELGLESRVVFTGYRHDLPTVLAALDLYVQPSLEKDTSPLSLVSAMATGLPVVASRVPGIEEIVGPDQGKLVAPGDDRALASAIGDLLADPAERKRLGAGARRRAEVDLSVNVFAERCQTVFSRAVERG